MKRHAPIPELQYLQWMLQILAEIVEQHIAQATAQNDAQRGIENQIVGMTARKRRTRLLQQLQQIPIADEDAGEVSETVPAEIEGADMQRDRRKTEIGEGSEAGIIGGLQGLPHQSSAPHK